MKFPTLKTKKNACFSVEALHGGCNLRDGNRTADGHLTAAHNVWWHNGALRTRPRFSKREDFARAINISRVTWKFCNEDTVKGQDGGRRFLRREHSFATGKVTFQTGILTHDGRILYEGVMGGVSVDVVGMVMEYPYTPDENVLIFLSDGRIYAQNSAGDWRQVNDEAYVPCVLIGGEGVRQLSDAPSTAGTPYEGRNMLTDKFMAKYTTTGTGYVFHMPYKGLDKSQPVTISIAYLDGGVIEYVIPENQTTCGYGKNGLRPVIDHASGVLYFLSEAGSLSAPIAGVANNMTITAYKPWTAKEKRLIASMSLCTWLGGSQAGCDSRQFISGSADASNRIYWSGQGQPLYFPDTNYIAVGDINQSITAFGKQDGMLVIFKEREIYSLSQPQGTVSSEKVDGQLVQAVTATSDYFPLTQLHGQIGCTAPHTVVLCGNRLCWASGTGAVYALIGHTVKELSALIAPYLTAYSEEAWQTANGALYEGHYLLQVEDTIYVLRVDEKAFRQYASVHSDSKAQQSLAWYIWRLPKEFAISFLYGSGKAVSGVMQRVRYTSLDTVYEVPLYINYEDDDGDLSSFEEWHTIPVSFSTKEYDFGRPFLSKRLLRVYLGLALEQGAQASFLYLHDGEKSEEGVIAMGERTGELTLTPHLAPVKRGGFMLTGVGKIAVDSLAFTYR